MLKRLILLLMISLFSTSFVNADDDFISHYEYGQMLYSYPRGVSCVECHGESGEGKVIAEFRDIHSKQQIIGPDIRQITLEKMIQALNDYHDIMPRYYLTDEEIKTIHDFLQEKYKRMNAKRK
ncbi:cytochrome c [Sulfurovum sp. zt1-1]|uniref:Cytochrome c n=1 Tax=Sulfurovum zhangzhouensis TaxID=3019067 RepID=A0ABT7QY08_9BACT|nr:c-type cytochrome [Sulfurovum zhangzhouensis]MDM5271718.1 cytochrome c [Sulfurovum zhangzhouensis]